MNDLIIAVQNNNIKIIRKYLIDISNNKFKLTKRISHNSQYAKLLNYIFTNNLKKLKKIKLGEKYPFIKKIKIKNYGDLMFYVYLYHLNTGVNYWIRGSIRYYGKYIFKIFKYDKNYISCWLPNILFDILFYCQFKYFYRYYLKQNLEKQYIIEDRWNMCENQYKKYHLSYFYYSFKHKQIKYIKYSNNKKEMIKFILKKMK